MIKLLFLTFQIASHKPILVPESEVCANVPDAIYDLASGLLCLPIDKIFKGDFE